MKAKDLGQKNRANKKNKENFTQLQQTVAPSTLAGFDIAFHSQN